MAGGCPSHAESVRIGGLGPSRALARAARGGSRLRPGRETSARRPSRVGSPLRWRRGAARGLRCRSPLGRPGLRAGPATGLGAAAAAEAVHCTAVTGQRQGGRGRSLWAAAATCVASVSRPGTGCCRCRGGAAAVRPRQGGCRHMRRVGCAARCDQRKRGGPAQQARVAAGALQRRGGGERNGPAQAGRPTRRIQVQPTARETRGQARAGWGRVG
jgi:hypothetical protein